MCQYYVLSYDSGREDLEVVSDYEMGDFDLTTFWSGKQFSGSIPSTVRLWVSEGKPSDYLGNPLSWPIVSEQFWSQICGLTGGSCQLVDVPLHYEGTESRVEGYMLMNVTSSIDALKSGSDRSIGSMILDKNRIPSNAHLFRLAESSTLLVVSHALIDSIKNKRFQGIALIELTVE